MTEKPGIYAITHLATGRAYVGSASNISKRWHRHRRELGAGGHCNAHLQAAWNRYGADAFTWSVLEFTSDLTAREQHWIDKLDAYEQGFNLCPTARSSRGRVASDEERAKRRAGGCAHLHTPEQLARASALATRNGIASRKLTLDQADEIRRRYGPALGNARPHARTSGRVTLRQLGDEFGISVAQVSAIVNGRSYKVVMPA